jgi:hypothetical protein
MAKMGDGKVREKMKAAAGVNLPISGTSIIMPTLQMDSSTVILGSSLGIPIMREGFTTETGLLLPSVAIATAILPTAK